MKSYRTFVGSLPPKTIVLAYNRFSPPTTDHLMTIHFVKKLALQLGADYSVTISHCSDPKKNVLSTGKRMHYMKTMFPDLIIRENDSTIPDLMHTVKLFNQKYKQLFLVTTRDLSQEQEKLLQKYNTSEYNFSSITVVPCGEEDPDNTSILCRSLAAKGDFSTFTKQLPPTTRDIDARRLMNDIRGGLGMEPIEDSFKLSVDTLREKYFNKEIYNIGDIVESIAGEKFEITKRGTNYLLVKDSAGNTHSKWLHEVYEGKQ